MTLPGVPPEGFRTVGQIVGTNDLRFRTDQDCMSIATDLLTTHSTGAPVLDAQDRFVGFISEIDLLRALCAGADLSKLQAEEIMTPCPVGVDETTSIPDALRIMEEFHILNLPVRVNGEFQYSISRHDILRAWVGLGLSRETATA
jgi:predicted transcriptional regulator